MNYCGIDLAGVSSYVYVTDDRGKKLAAGEVATEKPILHRAHECGPADANDAGREVDRLESTTSIQNLGRGPNCFHATEFARHVELVQYECDKLGWNINRLRGYRCRVQYPSLSHSIPSSSNRHTAVKKKAEVLTNLLDGARSTSMRTMHVPNTQGRVGPQNHVRPYCVRHAPRRTRRNRTRN